MFLYFPIWTLSNGGIGSVVISMASSLTTKGQPNDVLLNFNPLTIMLFVPLLSQIIYPTLQKRNLMSGRVTRISFGFFLSTISGTVGAVLQWHIYHTSPYGDRATGCKLGARVCPISVWAQTPIFVLSAISECFVVVTGCEIAYARSPKNLKAVVMAFFILIGALNNALAQILVPVTRDPFLVWIWAGPTIVLAVGTMQFWWAYRWMNKDDFMTYEE
jgi:dipeptide/tripeptide permease